MDNNATWCFVVAVLVFLSLMATGAEGSLIHAQQQASSTGPQQGSFDANIINEMDTVDPTLVPIVMSNAQFLNLTHGRNFTVDPHSSYGWAGGPSMSPIAYITFFSTSDPALKIIAEVNVTNKAVLQVALENTSSTQLWPLLPAGTNPVKGAVDGNSGTGPHPSPQTSAGATLSSVYLDGYYEGAGSEITYSYASIQVPNQFYPTSYANSNSWQMLEDVGVFNGQFTNGLFEEAGIAMHGNNQNGKGNCPAMNNGECLFVAMGHSSYINETTYNPPPGFNGDYGDTLRFAVGISGSCPYPYPPNQYVAEFADDANGDYFYVELDCNYGSQLTYGFWFLAVPLSIYCNYDEQGGQGYCQLPKFLYNGATEVEFSAGFDTQSACYLVGSSATYLYIDQGVQNTESTQPDNTGSWYTIWITSEQT